MNILQDSLYWLASGLLIPCIAFLLLMFAQSLIFVGKQISVTKRQQRAIVELTTWLGTERQDKKQLPETSRYLSCADTTKLILSSENNAFNRLTVAFFETRTEKSLSRFSNLAKLGPVTGLVGTLIPMGPALQGLADGNIQQLAEQMQIAFTTTVIGLIVGGIGFLLYQLNKRQTFLELSLLDYILEKQESVNAKV